MTVSEVAFSVNLYKNNEDFIYLNAYTVNSDTVEATEDNTIVINLLNAAR